MPALSDPATLVLQPEYAAEGALIFGGGLFVAQVDGAWAVVERPPLSARNRSLFCHSPSCRSSSRVCSNSQTVNAGEPELSDSDEAGDEEQADGEKTAVRELKRRQQLSKYADVDCPRRGRNMLPCPMEVERCAVLSEAAHQGSMLKKKVSWPRPLVEPCCVLHPESKAPD